MRTVFLGAAALLAIAIAGCADPADVSSFADTAPEPVGPASGEDAATTAAITDGTAPPLTGVIAPALDDGDECLLSTAFEGGSAEETVPLVGGVGEEAAFEVTCLPSVSIAASPDVQVGETGTFPAVPTGTADAIRAAVVDVGEIPGVDAQVTPVGGEVTIDVNDGMVLQGSFRLEVAAEGGFAGQLLGAFRVTPEGQGY